MQKITSLLRLVRSLKQDDKGAALVEYAVIVGLLLAASITVFTAIGGEVNRIMNAVLTAMQAAP